MFSFRKKSSPSGVAGPVVSGKKRRWVKWTFAVLAVLLFVGGVLFWKAGSVVKKIAPNGSMFSNIVNSLPGSDNLLKGEKDGRVNIALLGMRGRGEDGGAFLADTIMVFSFHPTGEAEGDTPRASLISVPRDLYVTVPGTSEKQKINAVFAHGEEQGGDEGGMKAMETILSEVTGQDIPYAVMIDFKGFEDLVNAMGGIAIHLDQAFTEPVQFREPHVCDPYVYTIPTSPLQYENKYYTRKDGTRYLAKSYPLCYNKNPECGGNFELPAGDVILKGDQALCYARSRFTSNDFERAKRQQMVIQAIKDKALSLGTLADFSKVNAMIDSLGDNAKTDMEGWELKRLFDLYQKEGKDAKLSQKVLDNTEEGLLYTPENTGSAGYILLPRGENYDRIHTLFSGILQ